MSRGLHLRVVERLVARALWKPGERVAVAVSGGRDSIVLLDLLHRTAGVHRGRLLVVTVDHGLREGSAEDAAVAVAAAEARGLLWRRARLGLGRASEGEARAARYAWLDGVDADVVALAHHRDDQVETLLLGLLRGHGARSLAGMAPRRGRYVRPLLDEPRAALAAWAERQGLGWAEDPTNASPDHLRNRVRHELVPLLESLRPGATEAAARTAGLLALDDGLLGELAEAVPYEPSGDRWAREGLLGVPEPVARRSLLQRLGEAATGAHLDAVLAAARRGRGRVALSSSVTIVVDRAWVRIVGVSRG